MGHWGAQIFLVAGVFHGLSWHEFSTGLSNERVSSLRILGRVNNQTRDQMTCWRVEWKNFLGKCQIIHELAPNAVTLRSSQPRCLKNDGVDGELPLLYEVRELFFKHIVHKLSKHEICLIG